jgi:hypothetical protein
VIFFSFFTFLFFLLWPYTLYDSILADSHRDKIQIVSAAGRNNLPTILHRCPSATGAEPNDSWSPFFILFFLFFLSYSTIWFYRLLFLLLLFWGEEVQSVSGRKKQKTDENRFCFVSFSTTNVRCTDVAPTQPARKGETSDRPWIPPKQQLGWFRVFQQKAQDATANSQIKRQKKK